MTVPPFAPDNIRKMTYEYLFESIQFNSVYCAHCRSITFCILIVEAASMALYGFKSRNFSPEFSSPCSTVVDSGFSFSHITPFFDNVRLNYATRRFVYQQISLNLTPELM